MENNQCYTTMHGQPIIKIDIIQSFITPINAQ